MTVATDNFTGANDTELSVYSANWSKITGGNMDNELYIQDNALGVDNADASDTRAAYWWNAASFAARQYSQATVISQDASGGYHGLVVRGSGTANGNCFLYFVDDADAGYIDRVTSGTATNLSSAGSVVSAGDIIRFEAEGINLRVYINGELDFAITNSSHATGSPGVGGYGNTSAGSPTPDTQIDDWEGGDSWLEVKNTPGNKSVQIV